MGEYADVKGLKTWFDTWGSGPPLVLLHGGLTSNSAWGMLAPLLAEDYGVVAPERRAHGHTPDVEGPITYQLMADDTIAFLDQQVGGPAPLVGWSDGGNVALLIAMQRPDLVTKVVTLSANFNEHAPVPESEEALRNARPDSPEWDFPRSDYEALSPDGAEHWPVAFQKIKEMILAGPNIDPGDLSKVDAPTLVISSDDDVIRLEHTIELYHSVPNAQLAVVPGSSHGLPMEKPDVVARLVLDFLQNDPTPTMMPVRRAPAQG